MDCEREDLNKLKSFYVRRGALSSNLDVKTYDVGNLNVATVSATATIGELYVEYRVRLMTPVLTSIGVGDALYAYGTGTSNAAPYGATALGTSNAPVTWTSSGTTSSVVVFTFSQQYNGILTIVLAGTGISGFSVTGSATQGFVQNTALASGLAGFISVVFTASPGQTVSVTVSNTTISAGNLWISQNQL